MSTPAAPTVRLATIADAAAIARLSGQLGYASTTDEIARRLADLNGNGEHAVYVADRDGMPVGWVHVAVSHSLLADTPAEIAGLVIEEHNRSRGIGRLLMEHAEQWARDKGCRSVRLRSNVVRFRAHTFYEGLGYRVTKSQKVFCKDLTV